MYALNVALARKEFLLELLEPFPCYQMHLQRQYDFWSVKYA
jgi:hypothetical protein